MHSVDIPTEIPPHLRGRDSLQTLRPRAVGSVAREDVVTYVNGHFRLTNPRLKNLVYPGLEDP